MPSSETKKGMWFCMPEESRNCGCNNGILGGILGGCGNNSEILFFIIIFLLLFTNFGCGCQRG